MRYRIANFVIDTSLVLLMLLFFVQFLNGEIEKNNVKWIAFCFYFVYYFLSELIWGKTLAKVLTKTKVAMPHDKKPHVWQIFIRTLTRLVIFDPLSYLFSERGLHDRISKTILVKENH